ncbi:hypothetical protein Tco_1262585 [Tanacetum coccineum]
MFVRLVYCLERGYALPLVRDMRWADGDFRSDYGFISTLDDEIIRDPERDVGYEITDTWDEMLVGMPGAPTTDETELGRQVTDLVMTVRQDTNKIYGRLDDAQTERQMVTSRVNMLFRDRRAYARTARLIYKMPGCGSTLVAFGHYRDALSVVIFIVDISDPEEDPEEDDKEDPKEDPADYPADGGDDSDDEDESSNDDEDDDVDIERD